NRLVNVNEDRGGGPLNRIQSRSGFASPADLAYDRVMLEQRLEELVVRGVGLAWVNGFSTIAVRALWGAGQRPAAQRIAAALLPVERKARLGWMTDAPARDVDYPGDAQAELLGAHAARHGLEAVTALLGRLGDRTGSAAALARAAAVVVEPGL